jgi:hypothetical protein
MSPDSLWRLRLKYEHSRGHCDLCGRLGTVGEDIKLQPPPESDSSWEEERGIPYMLRCADPVACRQRRVVIQ